MKMNNCTSMLAVLHYRAINFIVRGPVVPIVNRLHNFFSVYCISGIITLIASHGH